MISRLEFINRFGGVFEHSPFIAERAYDQGLVPDTLAAGTVHAAMSAVFRTATQNERLQVLRAHPDLAGKLAIAGELTDDSKNEQAGAGLDRLTPEEHARFTALNASYVEKNTFPFIIAVKGLSRFDILDAFDARIGNEVSAEFNTACAEVEKITLLRLTALLA
jgi:OHCU decarboxylase